MPASGGNKVTALPPGMELSADRIEKLSLIGRNAGNTAVGATYETVASAGGIRNVIGTSGVQLDIVSKSADDDNGGGSDCRRVKVRGLDENGAIVDENVNLDGTATVTTTNSYLNIYGFVGNKGAENVGTIKAYKTGETDTLVQIEPGTNQADIPHFQAPTDNRVYLTSFLASVSGEAYVSIWARRANIGNTWQKKFEIVLKDGTATYQLPNPIKLDPREEFEFRAKRVGSTDAIVRVDWQVIVEAD